MDTKEYIASGILESYVMGTASEQEQREVHCLSSIYPEIKEELNRIQQTLEDYVQSIAVSPPAGTKEAIMAKIKGVPQEKVLKKVEEQPKVEKVTKVVQMPTYAKLSLVASIAIVIGVSAMFVMKSQENEKLSNEVLALTSQNEQKQNEYLASLESLEKEVAETKALQEFVLNPGTEEVVLGGTETHPEAKVRVYWHKETQAVIVKNDALPTPTEGKQYQLWALADGVPVDLGVLDKDFAITPTRKIGVSELQTFAITLEDEGGKPTPDLTQLYVIGNVKG
ncbi:Anti-sigma-K factor rskA [Lishizhenia tianjinensis]|uniref:Anti-sigma-K factor rskA n=1 Tax=Lishizhenia tianjinensis TaxID=477690 RepID=A0A1I6ZR71_9FLAO|nr:anti-sigma factor [Lishizhenia tianjinensis]SFT65170.1 Anti-sigma-K factor rskA [Lishizhenia tianjinensis]